MVRYLHQAIRRITNLECDSLNSISRDSSMLKFIVSRLLFSIFFLGFNFNLLSAMEIGVCTHLGQNRVSWNSVRSAMTDLGVTSYRDEIYWTSIERSDRSITMSATPIAMQDALSVSPAPFRPMLIPGYGHPNYDQGSQPYSASGRTAYTRYVVALMDTYGAKFPYFEMWNEWNLGTGNVGGIPGTASAYAALLKDTVPAISPKKGSTKILIGATGDDLNDWSWTKQLFDTGVADLADGYSVHLYNYMAGGNAIPEEMFARLERLQQILRTYNDGNDYPIYVTELGWPTNSGAGGVSQELSGAYISRFLLEASGYSWIKGVWIYDLLNDGTDLTNREHNFGLYDNIGNPKLGTCSVRKAVALLNDFHLVAKGSLSSTIRWLQFENTAATTTAFIAFSNIKNTTSIVTSNAKPSSLCNAQFSPPSPPKLDLVTSTPSQPDSSQPPTSFVGYAPTPISVGEIPVVVMLNGVTKTIGNAFSLPRANSSSSLWIADSNQLDHEHQYIPYQLASGFTDSINTKLTYRFRLKSKGN